MSYKDMAVLGRGDDKLYRNYYSDKFGQLKHSRHRTSSFHDGVIIRAFLYPDWGASPLLGIGSGEHPLSSFDLYVSQSDC